MVNVFVFRVNCRVDFVKEELKEGRLRQGWGWDGTNLIGVEKDDWVEKQCPKDNVEGRKKYAQKYNELKRMLNIKEGDILIIPKVPTSSQFTICKAAGGYKFDTSGDYNKGDDFRHVIPIDKDSIRMFNYFDTNEYCENIHAKIGSYRAPVNNVRDEKYQAVAKTLLEQTPSDEPQMLSEIIERIKNDCFKSEETLNRLRSLGFQRAEHIVRLIFEKLGYEFDKRNSSDGKGGDADLIFFDRSLPEFYEVAENGDEIVKRIYVQVKDKFGEDKDDTEGIDQLMKRTKEETNPVKILISTADKFSEECKKRANENDVMLIDGPGFLKLVFKHLD